MKILLCAIGLSLTLGCATAIVRPYVGEQQAWPTSVGSIANVRYDLPVFTTLPPAPYEVLGELRISSPLYAQPEEGHLPLLCKKGIEIGADALVLVEGKIYFSTSYGVIAKDTGTGSGAAKVTVSQVNRFNPESFRPGVTVVAIRWTEGPPPGLPAKYARYDERLIQPPTPTETAPAVEAPATDTPAPETPPAPPPAEVPPAVLPAVPSELMNAAQPPPPPAPPEPSAAPAEQPTPAPPPTPEPPPEPAPPQRSAGEIMQEILEGPKAEPPPPPPAPPAP